MKFYLAGPMRGIPEFNYPKFKRAAAFLRAQGHFVFSPAEKDIERHGGIDISVGNLTGSIPEAMSGHGFSLREALRDDTHFLCTEAEGIALLDGWEASAGSFAEWALARALKLHFKYLRDGEY